MDRIHKLILSYIIKNTNPFSLSLGDDGGGGGSGRSGLLLSLLRFRIVGEESGDIRIEREILLRLPGVVLRTEIHPPNSVVRLSPHQLVGNNRLDLMNER